MCLWFWAWITYLVHLVMSMDLRGNCLIARGLGTRVRCSGRVGSRTRSLHRRACRNRRGRGTLYCRYLSFCAWGSRYILECRVFCLVSPASFILLSRRLGPSQAKEMLLRRFAAVKVQHQPYCLLLEVSWVPSESLFSCFKGFCGAPSRMTSFLSS